MFFNAYIGYDRSDKDMEGRKCTCPEEGENVDYLTGEGSSLPCMHDMNGLGGYPYICCRNCMYCQKVTTAEETTKFDMETTLSNNKEENIS